MTEPIEPQETDNTANDGNPAWASVLNAVPSQFHDNLRPELEKWDQGVQQRFQKVHSDYEAWKPFKEAGIQAENVNAALGLMNALENNPQEMLQTLQTYFEQQGIIQRAASGTNGTNGNQQQGQQAPVPPMDLGDIDPRLAARLAEFEAKNKVLEEQSTTLAQVLLKQQQDQQARQEDVKLDQELKAISAKFNAEYGYMPNERAIIGYAQGLGVDLQTAAKHYAEDLDKQLRQQRPPAPNLLGSGGNLPSNQVSLAGKTKEELDSIATEFLKNLNRGTV